MHSVRLICAKKKNQFVCRLFLGKKGESGKIFFVYEKKKKFSVAIASSKNQQLCWSTTRGLRFSAGLNTPELRQTSTGPL